MNEILVMFDRIANETVGDSDGFANLLVSELSEWTLDIDMSVKDAMDLFDALAHHIRISLEGLRVDIG